MLGPSRYLADPFGIAVDGRIHILCEEFDYETRKGLISAMELPSQQHPSKPREVLGLPIHMSYPFLLEYAGRIYCVPETAEAQETILLESESFPDRWRRVATLLRGVAAVDNTLFPHDGRWWLLCTDAARGPNSVLLAFYSETPFGPWLPHAANPVKTDLSSARPAGTPFVHAGTLYRPAQDCSETYGRRIAINEVVCLSPRAFEERTVAWVEPDPWGPYPDGIHTLSAVGGYTLIDGFRLAFVAQPFKDAVREEPGRLLGTLSDLVRQPSAGGGRGRELFS